MKKLYIAAVLILGLIQSGIAQEKGKVEFGLQVGYNSSSVSDSETTTDSGSGVNFGASADYYFSDRWSIKAKLIYDQKGWNNAFITTPDGDYRTNVNLNYLTIPVMANWHFAAKRNWYLNFGPYVGFLMDAKDTRFDTDLKEGFNTTDFGLAFGIGVKIPVTNRVKVFLEFQGQGGLSDIFKENDYSDVTNARSAFNVGINFLMQ